MKCNHCKKIIPHAEEICLEKKGYFHEECVNPYQAEQRQVQTKWTYLFIGSICGVAILVWLSARLLRRWLNLDK